MLEQYFLRPTTVDRIRSSWLAPQIEQYVEWMHAQKYAGHNITRRIALLCHFADFARTNGATDLASAGSMVEKFGYHWIAGNRCWNLETRPKLRRDICSIIRQMLRLILEGRVTRERGRPPFQFQLEAPGFFHYLIEERGMNKLTVARYLRYLNRLAGYLTRVEVKSLRDLSPQLLSSFVVETCAPQKSEISTQFVMQCYICLRSCPARIFADHRQADFLSGTNSKTSKNTDLVRNFVQTGTRCELNFAQ